MKTLFKFLSFIFILCAISSCSKNDCITCRLNGQIDSICEDELDVYNAQNGTSVTSLDQIVAIVEAVGGTCD